MNCTCVLRVNQFISKQYSLIFVWRWQSQCPTMMRLLIASFPSGSTYFSNDNWSNINNLWNTIVEWLRVYTRRGRASRRKTNREHNSGYKIFVETEILKIEGIKRNYIHESDCCACYDPVYAYTISTTLRYHVITAPVLRVGVRNFVLFIVRFAFVVYSIWIRGATL